MNVGAQADIGSKRDIQPKAKEPIKGGGSEWREPYSEGDDTYFLCCGLQAIAIGSCSWNEDTLTGAAVCRPTSGHKGPDARLRSFTCARRMQGPCPSHSICPRNRCPPAMISGRGGILCLFPHLLRRPTPRRAGDPPGSCGPRRRFRIQGNSANDCLKGLFGCKSGRGLSAVERGRPWCLSSRLG
ncbi:uncharacterized protein LY79DRAFT_136641 [Colletotrichum navitas]|uniref:Uncharacterized protein n=1 Tax=Colletotrichum navitas TaxID=681940 RepID=A0AAD8PK32_9PEZI|nr:uncharacterized protein LY79DRAFT_136641 [Colletotrichum navitas]KAK1564242.1 hypothetical protein LY79DRAFT_136641 [Colletotrichum navitas]